MRLLIDDIRTAELWPFCQNEDRVPREQWEAWSRHTKELLRKAPVFEVTNVSDYYYLGTSQEVWNVFADFPHPMPPFNATWFEWSLSKESQSGKDLIPNQNAQLFDRIGCYVLCEKVSDAYAPRLPKDVCMKLNFICIARKCGTHTIFVLPMVCFGLNVDFEPVSTRVNDSKVLYAYPGVMPSAIKESPDDFMEIGQQACASIHVPLLAISMLNCKNVTTRAVPSMSAELLRKHARRGHPMTAQHHIIEIQPVTQLLKRETGSASYSRAAAAIIRGHFKNYSEGAGLFGKLKGRFWWAQRIASDVVPEYQLAHSKADLDTRWPERLKR